jgi:phytoene dehydrogenase-like protein
MNPTAIVIGAGVGGLTVGGLLAEQGWRVVVIEKSDRVGGRCSQDAEGFDVGASIVMFPDLVRNVLAEAGTKAIPMTRVDPGYGVLAHGINEQSFDFTRESFERVDPRSWEEWQGLLAACPAFRTIFERLTSSPTPLASSPLTSSVADMCKVYRSLHGLVSAHITHPFLRRALTCHAAFVGAPTSAPGTSLFASLLSSVADEGVWYPTGPLGMAELPEALRQSIEKDGRGQVRLGVTVARVYPGLGVMLESGEFVRGQAIISNVPYLPGLELLQHEDTPSFSTALAARELSYSFSSVNFYLHLRSGLNSAPGVDGMVNLVCVGGPEDKQSNTLLQHGFTAGAPELDLEHPLLYIQSPGNMPGGSLHHGGKVCVLVIFPNLIDRPEGATREDVDTLYSSIMRVLKLEDQDVVARRVCTPQLWESDHGLPHGSILGPLPEPQQILDFRPRIRWQRGLYRVGSSTHPAAGVPSVMTSARIVARCVQEDLRDSPLLAPVRSSGTFGPSMAMIFTGHRRQALKYLYAFFRLLDDLVDEAPGGVEGLRLAQALVDRLCGGADETDHGLQVLRSCGIPAHVWEQFLEALRFDAYWQPGDAPPQMDWYAQRVAGIVGEAVGHVLSPGREMSPAEVEHRHMLGRALQRFNIVRDVQRDTKQRYIMTVAEAHRERARGSRDLRQAICMLRKTNGIRWDEQLWMETAGFAYESMAYGRTKPFAAARAICLATLNLPRVKAVIGIATLAIGLCLLVTNPSL